MKRNNKSYPEIKKLKNFKNMKMKIEINAVLLNYEQKAKV